MHWHQTAAHISQSRIILHRDLRIVFLHSNRISNRISRPIRFPIEFSNRTGRIYQRIFNPFHWYLFCICHEREWCTQLSTCYSFQFSPKTHQTMPLYDYLTPKLDFKRKFNHRQSFLYKGRLTMWTIRKFRIGSSLRIESRIGSSIRNRIESRRFAGSYGITKITNWGHESACDDNDDDNEFICITWIKYLQASSSSSSSSEFIWTGLN